MGVAVKIHFALEVGGVKRELDRNHPVGKIDLPSKRPHLKKDFRGVGLALATDLRS
jgi:hypothetical protein